MMSRLFLACLLLSAPYASGLLLDRRSTLQLIQLLQVLEPPTVAYDGTSAIAEQQLSPPNFPNAEITDKVYMDIRIARQDGSFYVRDDLPDTFENQVLKTRLVFGLYGKVAPVSVNQFLKYVTELNDPNDDPENPLPSYSRSTFTSMNQATGFLNGGNIPSLRIADVGGSSAIKYGRRVVPATLWLDSRKEVIPHSTKGLLTHRTLDPAPSFSITTRPCPEADATFTVFGQVMWTEETAQFLNILQDLPTYKMERPYEDSVVTTAVFNSQREVFRGVAKSFGDSRVDKVYEGKLLRRMEVTRVGRI